MGYDVVLVCPGVIPDSLRNHNITLIPIPLPTHNFNFNSSFQNLLGGVWQRIRNSILALKGILKINPCVCFCSQPDSWLISVVGKVFLHYKVVVDLREIYEDRACAFPKQMQPIIRKMVRSSLKFLSNFTDEIIHVSKARQEHYSYISRPGLIISPFPKIDDYMDLGIRKETEIISVVHAGSLRWTYAANEFIEAMPFVINQNPSIKFIVIGGLFSQLENPELIKKLEDSNHLIIFPFLSHKDVIDILLQSDIGVNLVLPLDQTHILAMPRKLFEYLAAGLPVVAADVPTIREVVIENNCGILVDPTSPGSIAKGILDLAANKHKLRQMGENGRKASELFYNWNSESQKLKRLLDTLI